jgi:hypothetical protein
MVLFSFPFALFQRCRLKGRQCWRIKKGIADFSYSLKAKTKKAEYPYIGHSACKKDKAIPISSGAFSGFIKYPAIVKRLDFPYIKVSFFVVLVNPR